MKTIKCRSGLRGTLIRLRDNYDGDYKAWKVYAEMYGLHSKLGFKSPKTAWRANPMLQISVNADDYCKIVQGKRVFHEV